MTKFSSNRPVKSTLTADQSLVKRALSHTALDCSGVLRKFTQFYLPENTNLYSQVTASEIEN